MKLYIICFFIFLCLIGWSQKSLSSNSRIFKHKKDHNGLGSPIWGYRFQLIGDFNGDNVQDTLYERFIDNETSDEINKFFENLDLMDHCCIDRDVKAFFECSNPKIKAFPIPSEVGLLFAETIGDIDGNGTDEIGLVNYNTDVSSVSRYYIYTYDGDWKSIYDFEVRDWEFPALPGYNPIYGFFGSIEHTNTSENEKLNRKLIAQILNYKRVRIVADKIIEFEGYCDVSYDCLYSFVEAVDTNQSVFWMEHLECQYPDNVNYERILYELYGDETFDYYKDGGKMLCEGGFLFIEQVKFK